MRVATQRRTLKRIDALLTRTRALAARGRDRDDPEAEQVALALLDQLLDMRPLFTP